MRKFLPHIVASLTLTFVFCVASDALAQSAGAPFSGSAVTPKPAQGIIEGWLSDKVVQAIVYLVLGILSLFAWLVGITGVLLNYAITYLVIGMGEMILTGGFGVAIEGLWRVMRDLVNLAFIFALLYLGITTIIQGSTAKVKTALASIIISMLLVNFSLYFAKAVIDVANFTAYSIYKQMADAPGSPGYIKQEDIGITGVFANRIGVSALLVSGKDSVQERILAQSAGAGGIAFILVYALGASIFLFKLAIAFAFGAFILIVRFATLILVMIFAPIAFLPADVPAMKKLRDRWWNTLLTQSFLAPVYLFGLYVTLLVLMHTPWQTNSGLAALFTGAAGSGGGTNFAAGFQALLFYVIAIVMLMGTTIAAKSLAASGAEVSTVLANAAKKGLMGASATGGFIGRNTIGRGVSKIVSEDSASGKTLRRWAGKSWAGEKLFSAANATAKGSMDLRSVGGIGKKMGVGEGGGKGGYQAYLDKQVKERVKVGESLGTRDTDEYDKSVTGGALKSAINNQKNSAKEENEKLADERATLAAMKAALNDPELTDSQRAAQEAEIKKQEKKVSDQREVAKGIQTQLDKNEKQYAEEKNAFKFTDRTAYAERIKTQREGRTLLWFKKGSRANKEAAAKIKKSTKLKDKDEERHEKLLDAVKDSAKKE